jgi:protein-tyrosine phosphatase
MLALMPDASSAQVKLMLEYSDRFEQQEIPDPYFGEDGFDLVFDMIDDAARGLLRDIRSQHGI